MTLIYNLSFNSMLYRNKNVTITVPRANSHPTLNQGIQYQLLYKVTPQLLLKNY